MQRYAQITNGIVTNVIESETDPDGINGGWVACDNAGPGYTYDGSTFTAPAAVPVLRHISVGSFFDRFGKFKYPILASTNVGVQALIKDCSVRYYIDLDNPELPTGLDLIIAAGFAIDKNLILTAPVLDSEKVKMTF